MNPCENGVVTVGSRATLPTLYVEDETGGDANIKGGSGVGTSLRYRNRSSDDSGVSSASGAAFSGGGANSGFLSTPPSSSTSPRANPSYGTPGMFSTPSASPPPPAPELLLPSTPTVVEAQHATCNVTAESKKPIFSLFDDDADAEFRFRSRLRLDAASSSSLWTRIDRLLPYLVMTIVLAGAAFTVLSLMNFANRDGGLWRSPDPAVEAKLVEAATAANGKYASMEFAARARAKRLAEDGRLPLEDGTVDDSGSQLGGKRASMQYVHVMQSAAAGRDKTSGVGGKRPQSNRPTRNRRTAAVDATEEGSDGDAATGAGATDGIVKAEDDPFRFF